MIRSSTIIAFGLSLILAMEASGQPGPAPVSGGLRERALVALNAFEVWAFVYRPAETDGNAIKCEPTPTSPPHACHAGTIPPCIACERYVPLLWPDPVETSREKFLVAERRMLATLDSAVRENPRDEMLVGTLVFMRAKRGQLPEAEQIISGTSCALQETMCELLRGYLHQQAGRTLQASQAFSSAVGRMQLPEYCDLMDASAVLDDVDRASYAQLNCAQRAVRDSIFWWLADPSYLVPGNDRMTEHVARAVGNKILKEYRSAGRTIAGILWYASLVPRSDSIQNFADYDKWVRHPAGMWRWRSELTRFGVFDAIDVAPGSKRKTTMTYRTPAGGTFYGVPTDGCAPLVGLSCNRTPVVCAVGYEPREMHLQPRDSLRASTDTNSLPRRGTDQAALYPSQIFFKYDWSDASTESCARLYNTKARYEFTPQWRSAADPFATTPESWLLQGDPQLVGSAPSRELYTPRYAPVAEVNEFQIARFPRGDSMLVVAVANYNGDSLNVARKRSAAGKWEAALIVTDKVPPTSERDVLFARAQSDAFVSRQILRGVTRTASILAAIEYLSPDTLGFARMRTGIPISPWLQGSTRLSDIIFFQPTTNARASSSSVSNPALDSILPHAFASQSVRRGSNLGLYWEIQAPRGLTATELSVSITVTALDVNRSFFGRIFGGSDVRAQSIVVTMPVPSIAGAAPERWGNALTLQTNSMLPGEYELSILVNGMPTVAPATVRSLRVHK